MQEVALIADVQNADNSKTQTLTLRGVTKTVHLKIKAPEQLKQIHKGEQIEGIFAEALAVSVILAPMKAKK